MICSENTTQQYIWQQFARRAHKIGFVNHVCNLNLLGRKRHQCHPMLSIMMLGWLRSWKSLQRILLLRLPPALYPFKLTMMNSSQLRIVGSILGCTSQLRINTFYRSLRYIVSENCGNEKCSGQIEEDEEKGD